jgi:hypothetical protein
MLLASLMVVLVATVVTSRALSLRMGEGFEEQAQRARDAANNGMVLVKAELERPENRSLVGDPTKLNWNTLKVCPSSCAIGEVTSTNWCVLPVNGECPPHEGKTFPRFRVFAAVWKNSNLETLEGEKFLSADDSENAHPSPDPPPIDQTRKFLQVTIEGQSFFNAQAPVAKSRITQVFELVDCPTAPPGSTSTGCLDLGPIRYRSIYGNT